MDCSLKQKIRAFMDTSGVLKQCTLNEDFRGEAWTLSASTVLRPVVTAVVLTIINTSPSSSKAGWNLTGRGRPNNMTST